MNYLRKMKSKERYDLSPLLANADVFREAVQDLAEPFKSQGVTKVAALDALGFAFGGGVAHLLGAGLVLVRKGRKTMWHAEAYAFQDYSRTTKTFEIVGDAVQAGDNILVVDDWSETGAQLKAAFHLIERLQARVAGAALLHIGEPVRRDPSLAAYTLHHLFDYYRDLKTRYSKPLRFTAQVPDFSAMAPEQEADWWDEHDIADALWEEGPEIDAAVYRALGIPDPAAEDESRD